MEVLIYTDEKFVPRTSTEKESHSHTVKTVTGRMSTMVQHAGCPVPLVLHVVEALFQLLDLELGAILQVQVWPHQYIMPENNTKLISHTIYFFICFTAPFYIIYNTRAKQPVPQYRDKISAHDKQHALSLSQS